MGKAAQLNHVWQVPHPLSSMEEISITVCARLQIYIHNKLKMCTQITREKFIYKNSNTIMCKLVLFCYRNTPKICKCFGLVWLLTISLHMPNHNSPCSIAEWRVCCVRNFFKSRSGPKSSTMGSRQPVSWNNTVKYDGVPYPALITEHCCIFSFTKATCVTYMEPIYNQLIT